MALALQSSSFYLHGTHTVDFWTAAGLSARPSGSVDFRSGGDFAANAGNTVYLQAATDGTYKTGTYLNLDPAGELRINNNAGKTHATKITLTDSTGTPVDIVLLKGMVLPG